MLSDFGALLASTFELFCSSPTHQVHWPALHILQILLLPETSHLQQCRGEDVWTQHQVISLIPRCGLLPTNCLNLCVMANFTKNQITRLAECVCSRSNQNKVHFPSKLIFFPYFSVYDKFLFSIHDFVLHVTS